MRPLPVKTPQDRLKIIQKIINGEDGNYDDNNSEINIRMVSCSEVQEVCSYK